MLELKKRKPIVLNPQRIRPPQMRIKPPVMEEEPPTLEELNFNELLQINPLLNELVNRFDLVSTTTGEPIKVFDQEPPKNPNKELLNNLAKGILQEGTQYAYNDLINLISSNTRVNKTRAENGLKLMVEAGVIEERNNNYCLKE